MKTGSLRILSTLLILTGAALATPLAAQEGTTVVAQATTYTPHFFMAVLGGVILAIGFQILLTSLSVASGISLVGDLDEKGEKAREDKRREKQSRHDKFEHDEKRFEDSRHVGAHNVNYEKETAHEQALRAEARRDETRRQQERADEEEEDSAPVIVTISRAIGVWTVVTASLSLFFASLLAVRLSMIGTVWMGVTLGLIIWAAFFATMTYLEIRSVSTLIGGVFGTALDGLRGSFAAAKTAFGASPEQRIVRTATDLAGNVRDEVITALEGFDSRQILDRVDEYVERLKPQELDFDRVKAELTDLLRNIKLEEHADVKEGRLDRETFIRLAQDQPHFKKKDVQKLSGIYDDISESLKGGGSGTSKAEALTSKLTGTHQDDVHQYRARLETYLRETGREELNPDRITQDIDRMFDDPKSSPEILMNRLKAMDRDTIIAVLSQRDDITPDKAEQIVGNVEKAVQFVQEKVLRMKSQAGAKSGQMKEQAAGMQGQAQGAMQSAISGVTGLPGRLEDRLRDYFASLNRPEFNYDRLRLDFERMLHHPKDSLKILRTRMKLYDRDSLKALLMSREGTSEAEAERMVAKFEEARDNVMSRTEQVEEEIRRRIESAKRAAWHEAESVRKASAVAAWWMVGTAVASGIFSALGAVIAMTW